MAENYCFYDRWWLDGNEAIYFLPLPAVAADLVTLP